MGHSWSMSRTSRCAPHLPAVEPLDGHVGEEGVEDDEEEVGDVGQPVLHPLDAHGLGLVLEEEEDGRDVEEEGEEELEDYARRQHLRKGQVGAEASDAWDLEDVQAEHGAPLPHASELAVPAHAAVGGVEPSADLVVADHDLGVLSDRGPAVELDQLASPELQRPAPLRLMLLVRLILDEEGAPGSEVAHEHAHAREEPQRQPPRQHCLQAPAVSARRP
mmetsp:Transcript_16203/g.38824  ORF Transcript_16203/g.38824 Transcript_16203/m.38824 type:complete len:219 (-) Transcript_16203:77-733(-)